MEAVEAGADRQDAHEVVRGHAIDVARKIKEEGAENDLLERLSQEPLFASLDLSCVTDPSEFVGRAPAQVDHFIATVVEPIRANYSAKKPESVELRV